MCIRDRARDDRARWVGLVPRRSEPAGGRSLPLADRPGVRPCLLYTSDAADDLLCVDLGGRRIIKKKTSYR